MPSSIALTLCILLILFLLRLDHKQYPDASFSLWIPTIWFLLVSSKPLGVWLGLPGQGVDEGSPLNRNFLILLLICGFFIIKSRKVKVLSFLKQHPSITLLLVFMFVSILWSDIPYISFKRWTRNFIAVIMAIIVASDVKPLHALQSLFRRIIFILIPLSYLLIQYFPHLGRDYLGASGELMWVGVSNQKNGLARLCMFSIVYLIWIFIKRRQGSDPPASWYQAFLEIFIALLSIWLFMGPNKSLTYSATSFATLVIVLSLYLVLLYLKKRFIVFKANTISIIIAIIIIYGTVTPFIGRVALFNPAESLGRDSTLTGRTGIWADLVPQAMQRPVIGYGFGGFWTDAKRTSIMPHAHNGYLDIILNTGFVGLILWSIFLISASRSLQKLMYINFDWAIFGFCILVMAVIHNIAESSMTSLTGFFPATLLFLLLSLPSNGLHNFRNHTHK